MSSAFVHEIYLDLIDGEGKGVEDSDLAHFFEDTTEVIKLSEITPLLLIEIGYELEFYK